MQNSGTKGRFPLQITCDLYIVAAVVLKQRPFCIKCKYKDNSKNRTNGLSND